MISVIAPLVLGLSMVSQTPAELPSSETCPTPARQLPLYPISMMRNNVTGETLVKARIDDCGRVVEPEVVESSGHAALDQAAIDTVLLWVLNEDERRQVGDDWVNLPVRFGGVRTVVPKAVDWPRSHRRPSYLPDEAPIGFATIEALLEAAPGRSQPVLKSPYGSVRQKSGVRTSTWFQQDRDDPAIYWLGYKVQIPPPADAPRGTASTSRTVAVARYRLVMEAGSPVVRVGLLCEETPDACTQLREFLMKGLPIARPRRG